MLLHCQILICLLGHSKLNMDWNLFFFFQDCFYITLLIIMFTRMFGIQYRKCNNICNT